MPLLVRNLTLMPGENEDNLKTRICTLFSLALADIQTFQIVRKGLDARKKGAPRFIYTIEFSTTNDRQLLHKYGSIHDVSEVSSRSRQCFQSIQIRPRVVIVGMGPAGLFAALRLCEYGIVPIILERGKPVEARLQDIQSFWGKGVLDPESNVQFGEGGAGTFSDGKLTTRVKDENIRYVLEKLIAFGAPPEIAWLAKPHIGTDRLRDVVRGIRGYLHGKGADIRFATRLTDISVTNGAVAGVLTAAGEEIACDSLILAPGNSARDTFSMLVERAVALEPKPFAVGLRVEHPQEMIDRIQYGNPVHPSLPPADYTLAFNDGVSGRSAYSFCMCPGGVVVGGASEAGGVVTNGMSNYRRNSPYANSALVVTVNPADFPSSHPLGGVEFQRDLESKAFDAGGGGYRAPVQNLMAFIGKKGGAVRSSYRPGTTAADLHSILPPYVTKTLRDGIYSFDRKMRGFISSEATLTAVETRTSSPVRIVRGVDMQSISVQGLYPAGEGAGYAGGIMSSALDGIRVADALAAAFIDVQTA